MITEEEITNAYGQLNDARFSYGNAVEKLTVAKADLDFRRAAAIASGTIEGKNAEQREAAVRDLLGEEYTNVDTAELAVIRSKLALDLAQIEVDRIHETLRLLSLVQPV